MEHVVAPDLRRHERPEKHRGRMSCVAKAVDTECRALPFGRKPARREADADGERRTGDAEQEGGGQQFAVGLGRWHEPGGGRDEEEQQREHEPPAEAVGEDADRKTRERPE